MDNADRDTWSAPLAAVWLGIVAAVGLLAWVLLGGTGSDRPGRLLLGVAALAIGTAAAVGLRARPRLAASDEDLVLRTVLGLRRWRWDRVDAVRSMRVRRLGLPSTYLEIDARDDDGTERLLVLGRLELGVDPADVADALQARRARAGRARSGRPSDLRAESAHQDDRPGDDEHDEGDGDAPGHGEPRRGT